MVRHGVNWAILSPESGSETHLVELFQVLTSPELQSGVLEAAGLATGKRNGNPVPVGKRDWDVTSNVRTSTSLLSKLLLRIENSYSTRPIAIRLREST